MQRIPREQARKFAFDWRDEPLLRVEPGESFEVETYDASNGYIQTRARQGDPGASARLRPRAAAGQSDRRADLGRGRRARRRAGRRRSRRSWSTTTPGSRSARGAARWASRRAGPSCRATTRPRSSATRPAPAARPATARSTSDDNDRWPITPFIGTLGVAPDREVTTSLDGQGEWGGNLDIRDVAPGNRIFLPVFHPGALFYLGDVHASQGDTEFTGTAAETKATVRLRLELMKGKRIPWMRIEKPDSPDRASTPTGRWTSPSRRRRST